MTKFKEKALLDSKIWTLMRGLESKIYEDSVFQGVVDGRLNPFHLEFVKALSLATNKYASAVWFSNTVYKEYLNYFDDTQIYGKVALLIVSFSSYANWLYTEGLLSDVFNSTEEIEALVYYLLIV